MLECGCVRFCERPASLLFEVLGGWVLSGKNKTNKKPKCIIFIEERETEHEREREGEREREYILEST